MHSTIPKEIADAIAAGAWRDPGPAVVQELLGKDLELPELELFEEIEEMQRVAGQLEDAGYVDDPEFCMTRRAQSGAKAGDPRLVFGDALFIAGSIVPGDDIFVVIDMHDRDREPEVRVFDWREDVPRRWVVVGKMSEFVERLSKL